MKPRVVVIETVRDCNLRCKACPTVYARDFPQGIMDMESFRRIADNAADAGFKMFGVTGWGEPLMDPEYREKMRYLKRKGLIVGSTTNSLLLTEELMRFMVEEGLDYLWFSVDAFHLGKNKRAYEAVVRKMEVICELKERLNSKNPEIGATVVVDTDSVEILDFLIPKLSPVSSSVGIIPTTVIPTREVYSKLVPRRTLELYREKFTSMGFNNLNFPYLDPPPKNDCRSGVFENFYVTVRGELCPCCVLAMEFPLISFEGKTGHTKKLVWGNLKRDDFSRLLVELEENEFYLLFRSGKIPKECELCNAWRKME